MNLGPWESHVDPPGFTFHVPSITLPAGSIVQVLGDNGAGKTVFLEHVLLPRLEEQGLQVFFVAQDLALQAHVLAAALAAQGTPAPRARGPLVEAWAGPAGAGDVLVLDETDRHLTPEEMHRLLALPVAAAFLVSHQVRSWPVTHCLSVTRRGRAVTIREVQP
ncbi:MAG: hypothetical protein JG774_1264 [Desulfomicrobiaceae bacterium]|jgi:ABC-type uncharacterized transport system ATPase subunit|nr:hypothetical protein [Desulfomicrobiaceae bacterium]MBZ4685519.1 hypothetical protein [Desulfomicrobiaceae bacterium]